MISSGRPCGAVRRLDLEPRPRPRKIHADNSIALFEAAVQQVGLDEFGRPPVAVDKCYMRRAPAQGFDADRSAAGIAIQHSRAHDRRAEDIEERLAQLVGRRAQAVPRRRFEAPALQRARDNPQRSTLNAHPSTGSG